MFITACAYRSSSLSKRVRQIVGFGSVTSVLCSSQSDLNNTPIPSAPNGAKALNIGRVILGTFTAETFLRTSAATELDEVRLIENGPTAQ